jgi:hypothetical protein
MQWDGSTWEPVSNKTETLWSAQLDQFTGTLTRTKVLTITVPSAYAVVGAVIYLDLTVELAEPGGSDEYDLELEIDGQNYVMDIDQGSQPCSYRNMLAITTDSATGAMVVTTYIAAAIGSTTIVEVTGMDTTGDFDLDLYVDLHNQTSSTVDIGGNCRIVVP